MAMRVAARVAGTTSERRYVGENGALRGQACKNFESVLGPLRLERAYYHCELCEAGFCRDRVLGLEGGSLSPGVLRMAGLVGAMVSFEEGHELLHELAGVDVPTKHARARGRGAGA